MVDPQQNDRTILIVDDEPSQRRLLGGFVESLGFACREAGSAEEAIEAVGDCRPEMVLLDVRLPGMSGIEAVDRIRDIAADLPVLLITAHADLRDAVKAVKSGAADYLAKPIDLDELRAALADAIGLATGPPADRADSLPALPDDLICESPGMKHVVQTVATVADSDAPMLVTGESGVGKEVVARLIHAWSGRCDEPLVTANCAGLPESLIESELFGHTKGAFTGADRARQGVFRTSDGGTLMLDEIGELPLSVQPKLLRALEAGQITPVGSDVPVDVDTRLIAATNRNLDRAVADGTFREDLYYRINVVELVVPPLRERHEDILPLARRFGSQLAGTPVRFSQRAMQSLLAHAWPGNVRELRNAVQRACLLCRGDVILPEHLPKAIAAIADRAESAAGKTGRLPAVERATILATLAECNENRTQAAKKLGISRRALIYKIRAMEGEG